MWSSRRQRDLKGVDRFIAEPMLCDQNYSSTNPLVIAILHALSLRLQWAMYILGL
jgi:hypothetical protein